MTTNKIATMIIGTSIAVLAALTTAFAVTGAFEPQPEWGAPRYEQPGEPRTQETMASDEDKPDATSSQEETREAEVEAPAPAASQPAVGATDENDDAPKAGTIQQPSSDDHEEDIERPERPERPETPDQPEEPDPSEPADD